MTTASAILNAAKAVASTMAPLASKASRAQGRAPARKTVNVKNRRSRVRGLPRRWIVHPPM